MLTRSWSRSGHSLRSGWQLIDPVGVRLYYMYGVGVVVGSSLEMVVVVVVVVVGGSLWGWRWAGKGWCCSGKQSGDGGVIVEMGWERLLWEAV